MRRVWTCCRDRKVRWVRVRNRRMAIAMGRIGTASMALRTGPMGTRAIRSTRMAMGSIRTGQGSGLLTTGVSMAITATADITVAAASMAEDIAGGERFEDPGKGGRNWPPFVLLEFCRLADGKWAVALVT